MMLADRSHGEEDEDLEPPEPVSPVPSVTEGRNSFQELCSARCFVVRSILSDLRPRLFRRASETAVSTSRSISCAFTCKAAAMKSRISDKVYLRFMICPLKKSHYLNTRASEIDKTPVSVIFTFNNISAMQLCLMQNILFIENLKKRKIM